MRLEQKLQKSFLFFFLANIAPHLGWATKAWQKRKNIKESDFLAETEMLTGKLDIAITFWSSHDKCENGKRQCYLHFICHLILCSVTLTKMKFFTTNISHNLVKKTKNVFWRCLFLVIPLALIILYKHHMLAASWCPMSIYRFVAKTGLGRTCTLDRSLHCLALMLREGNTALLLSENS